MSTVTMPNWLTACKSFDLHHDPLRFAHRYSDPHDAECVAFVSAMAAYGQRSLFLALLEQLWAPLGPHPVDWLLSHQSDLHLNSSLQAMWPDFKYRFNTRQDFIWLLQRLRWVYSQHHGLENLLLASDKGNNYQHWLTQWMTRFLGDNPPQNNGLRYLLAHPGRNSSCKRLHLFLRWMVRGPDGTDLGLWQNSLSPAQLLIPLDTHVAKAARHLGLISRKTNDWQTSAQLTQALRQFCPDDPVSLDLALFQLGQTL
jgi:uncharacterized protein (TIGR02757 family)